MIDLNILSYRRLAFARRYGFVVRDLMMLRAFEKSPAISQINVYERPSLPHELIAQVVKGVPALASKTTRHSGWDVAIPKALLQGRRRAAGSFHRHDSDLRAGARCNRRRVLLDFNPFYIPPIDVVRGSVYWYDCIDNFLKHNRFSRQDVAAVHEKYEFVKKYADVVTGVTARAVEEFNGTVVPNRLLRDSIRPSDAQPDHDVGFLGFLTDKFDLDFIRTLNEAGLRILICGHAYDNSIVRELEKLPNVTYDGPFSADEVPDLIARFRVGMVPYRQSRRHDESPIKFFQYVAYGRPVMLSGRFNAIEKDFSDYVYYYREDSTNGAVDFVAEMTRHFEDVSNSLRQLARSHPDLFWESVVDGLLEQVVAQGERTVSSRIDAD